MWTRRSPRPRRSRRGRGFEGVDINITLPEDAHARRYHLAADGAVRVLRRAGAAEDVAAGHECGRLLRLETDRTFVALGRAGCPRSHRLLCTLPASVRDRGLRPSLMSSTRGFLCLVQCVPPPPSGRGRISREMLVARRASISQNTHNGWRHQAPRRARLRRTSSPRRLVSAPRAIDPIEIRVPTSSGGFRVAQACVTLSKLRMTRRCSLPVDGEPRPAIYVVAKNPFF